MPECQHCGATVRIDEYGRGEIPAGIPPTHGVYCSTECHARDRHAERKRVLSEMKP